MALFANTAHFATQYPALQSVDWQRLLPSVEFVELTYLRNQVLGAELYDELHTAYQASITTSPVAMSAALAALHAKVIKPLAHLVVYEAIPELNVLFTSGGLKQSTGQDMENATMWRTRDARYSALKKGHAFLDLLIAHLVANESSLTAWASAPMRQEVRESIIPSLLCTDAYLREVNSAWLLYKIRPALRGIQNGAVRNLIGSTDLATLLGHVHANPSTVTADEQLLLNEARPFMLHTAIANLMLTQSITIDEQGVWSWQAATSGGQTSGGEQPAANEKANARIREHRRIASEHYEELRKLVEPTIEEPNRLPNTDGNMML